MATMNGMENPPLKQAVDEARKRWHAKHGKCSMCNVGDEPVDGLHRGMHRCGNESESVHIPCTSTTTKDVTITLKQRMLDVLHEADVWHRSKAIDSISARRRSMHRRYQEAIWWAILELEDEMMVVATFKTSIESSG